MAKTETVRSEADMLREIETANGREGPDPIRSEDATTLRALGNAVQLRDHAHRATIDAIRACRDDGASWSVIGAVLGVSRQAARQRYEPLM